MDTHMPLLWRQPHWGGCSLGYWLHRHQEADDGSTSPQVCCLWQRKYGERDIQHQLVRLVLVMLPHSADGGAEHLQGVPQWLSWVAATSSWMEGNGWTGSLKRPRDTWKSALKNKDKKISVSGSAGQHQTSRAGWTSQETQSHRTFKAAVVRKRAKE